MFSSLAFSCESGQATFIYIALLKTTGVDPKCSPVEADGLTIQVDGKGIRGTSKQREKSHEKNTTEVK